MSDMKRSDIPPVLRESPVVVVLRAKHASEYAPVIEALVAGGILSIELTLSTAGAMDELPGLIERFAEGGGGGDGARVDIGLGTITTREEAAEALERGAAYLVTPAMQPEVVALAVSRGVPVFPGGLTPSELLSGWQSGATAVKLFPASTVGPGYLAQLRGPFPYLPIIPSGGIGIDDAAAWIEAGATAVSIGGPLLQDAFSGGNRADLTARAASLTRLVAAAAAERNPR